MWGGGERADGEQGRGKARRSPLTIAFGLLLLLLLLWLFRRLLLLLLLLLLPIHVVNPDPNCKTDLAAANAATATDAAPDAAAAAVLSCQAKLLLMNTSFVMVNVHPPFPSSSSSCSFCCFCPYSSCSSLPLCTSKRENLLACSVAKHASVKLQQ